MEHRIQLLAGSRLSNQSTLGESVGLTFQFLYNATGGDDDCSRLIPNWDIRESAKLLLTTAESIQHRPNPSYSLKGFNRELLLDVV